MGNVVLKVFYVVRISLLSCVELLVYYFEGNGEIIEGF